MPYTSAQLIAAYTAANNGVAPDAATTTLLTAFATQTQTGQLSDNAALAYVINSADKTTAVANQSYQFFTGKTPLKAGLDYLTNSTANATDLNDPYYASFNIENRYMNFAANLGILGDGATAFNTTYGTTAIPLWSTFVGVIYETIIGSSYAAAAGINVTAAINDVIGRQAAFTQIARERGIITSTSTQAQIDIATRAVAVGYLLVEGIKADVGVYAAGSNNLVNAMINGTAQYNVNLITTYAPLGGGTGSPVSSGSPITGGIPGSTFAFTGGLDALVGTANDDTFNGSVVQNPSVTNFSTFGAIDGANGQGGNDTLNVTISSDTGAALAGAFLNLPTAAVTGIENINIRVVDPGGPGTVNAVATNFAGAVNFNNDRSTGTAGAAPTLALTGLASGQNIGIVGLGGATVVGGLTAVYGTASSSGTSTFSYALNLSGGTGSGGATGPTVTVTSATGAVTTATINSNGAVANVVGAVQLDDVAGAGTVRTLNLKADSALTTGNITGFGGASAGGATATTGTINVTGLANVTLGTIAGNGGGLTTLNINTGPGTLTTGNIGVVTTNPATAANAVFAGGATINVSGQSTTTTANTAAVNIGTVAGNVTTLNASGLTAGGVNVTLGQNNTLVFTGGTGTDIVAFGGNAAEVQQITVTGGAAGAGNTTFFGVATAVAGGDSATDVATKIAANAANILAANPQLASITSAGAVLTVTWTPQSGNVAPVLMGPSNGSTFTTTATTTEGVDAGAAYTGTVNGGAGNDIIAFGSGASLGANLTALVSNFEILRVSNATGQNQVFDPTLINGITSYQVGAITGAGSTTVLSNLVANANVTIFGANATAANVTTLQLKDASGASDVVNVRIDNLSTSTAASVNGINAGVLAFGGTASAGAVETLNITSAGRVTGTGTYNLVGLAQNANDPTTVKISGAAGLNITTGAVTHNQIIDASAHTGGVVITTTAGTGAGGSLTLIGSGKNDTFTFAAATATVASIYGGAGGDSINLATGAGAGPPTNGVQTIVYKAASDSTLDLTGTVSATGNVGASGTGGTVNAGTMDIINGFQSGTDKIDVSTFGFGAGGLGGGIADKGTVTSDAAFNTILTTGTGINGVFGDGIVQRGLAIIHGGAGMGSGVAGDFLLIDVNKDGAFTAGSDIAVKLTGTINSANPSVATSVVITDFII